MRQFQILAISGSLRADSLNSAVLRVAASVSSEQAQVRIFSGLADLPHFNPDLEGNEATIVHDFRRQLREADAVLIACPEYAHGLPGAFKNALDWVVASGEFVYKPVALVNLFERSTWAPALLKETLNMMTANIVEPASINLQLASNKLDEKFMLADDKIVQSLRASLRALLQAIQKHETES